MGGWVGQGRREEEPCESRPLNMTLYDIITGKSHVDNFLIFHLTGLNSKLNCY